VAWDDQGRRTADTIARRRRLPRRRHHATVKFFLVKKPNIGKRIY
jgi:hypothetical protein